MKKIYLSHNANSQFKEYLSNQGHVLEEIPDCAATYPGISSHPDLFLCKMGIEEDSPIIRIDSALLGYHYPENIRMNGVYLKHYFIHNLHHTDSRILDMLKINDLTPIHVKQGYTKCNIVIVDERSIITSDEGIAKILRSYPIDVLLITPEHVVLTGFPYGFLGGASGCLKSEILFHGNLAAHPDFLVITRFIEARGKKVTYFPNFPLTDIGSVIEGVLL